ncbi:MAG TPA: hypothetical protein VER96_31590 [Polyangiaceae bacterium]|nr:hypothetical protein [Polyangiaceae bacterium]
MSASSAVSATPASSSAAGAASSPVVVASAAVPVSSASAIPVATPSAAPPTRTTLPGRLDHFFAGYKDGSDFEFLRADCQATLQDFITLRNTSVADVIRNVKAFFRDKRRISYQPDAQRMRVQARNDGQLVSIPVAMSWAYPTPKEWLANLQALEFDKPMIERQVTVNVEIELAADGRIMRYLERGVERPWLRVTGDENCENFIDGDAPIEPWLVLDRGTTVRDLGETIVLSFNTKGPNIARRVRSEDEEGWAISSVSFAVPNPFGGSSAGGSDCLAPVPAPKKAR